MYTAYFPQSIPPDLNQDTDSLYHSDTNIMILLIVILASPRTVKVTYMETQSFIYAKLLFYECSCTSRGTSLYKCFGKGRKK